MGFQSDDQRKAVMAILKQGKWSVKRRGSDLLLLNSNAKAARKKAHELGTFTNAAPNPPERVGYIMMDPFDTYTRSGKKAPMFRGSRKNKLLQTHSGLEPEFRGMRLGTALYLLALRDAKRRGYGGLASLRATQSEPVSKVWASIREGDSEVYGHDEVPDGERFDYITSTKAHRRRRGQYKRKKRQGKLPKQKELF